LKTHHTFSNVFKPFFKEMLGKGFCNPRAQRMAAHWKCQQQQLQLEASMQGRPQPKHFKKINLSKKVPHVVTFILVNSGHFWSHLVRCELSLTQKFVSEHPPQTVSRLPPTNQ
jgi:hypothetical protein